MAGPKTTKFLAPNKYETFYQLVHEFSELALGAISNIGGFTDILIQFLKDTPTDIFADPTRAKLAETLALDLGKLALHCAIEIRQFFWITEKTWSGQMTFEEMDEINQKRWSPYDTRAWDTLYSDFVLLTQSGIESMDNLIQKLRDVEDVGNALVKSDGTTFIWKVGDYIPSNFVQRLGALLTEKGVETELFT